MSEAAKGFWAMVLASTIWGISSLYYKALSMVPPLEILAHRTIWTLVFFGLILAAQGRLGALGQALRGRQARWLVFAAVMVSMNWFIFIRAVQQGQAVEASLGYYIFPLLLVVVGAVFFREKVGVLKCLAVGLATLAVLVLTWGLGAAPWIALILATSFGLYGVVKRQVAAGPVVSVAAEVLLLSPFALAYLVATHSGHLPAFLHDGQIGGYFGSSLPISIELAFSGLLTGGPLILFSYAARRVALGTVGLVQYVNPTLQFLCATLVFHEPVTPWHILALGLIWLGLALYSYASLRRVPPAVPV
ncbi:EamA family transporter RarD [Phaeovulum sp. W22_SRMD_FR3]|uniref:EamA family transporter RarD n=1 Tax=Phaeovulum sp. W22_SRMD_FR3 TaxID=3240274 RepID=UPI003F9CCB38